MSRKLAKRQVSKFDTSIKVTIRLDLEVAQRLGCEAAMTRKSQSRIVQESLQAHLRCRRLPGMISPADARGEPTEAPAAFNGDSG